VAYNNSVDIATQPSITYNSELHDLTQIRISYYVMQNQMKRTQTMAIVSKQKTNKHEKSSHRAKLQINDRTTQECISGPFTQQLKAPSPQELRQPY
jgi:hypothetical protein